MRIHGAAGLSRVIVLLIAALVMTSFLGALLLHGCSSSEDAALLPGRMRIGIQDNAVSTLLFIADATGAFRTAGVECDILRYPSGKAALQALGRGEVEIVTVADMPIMRHGFRGQDIAVLTSICTTDRGAWVAARRDHGIAGVADLRGKRIGTQGNSAVHFFLGMLLLANRIQADEVEILLMNPAELVPALVAGRVDAISMRNPYMIRAREALGADLVEIEDPLLYRMTFNLVADRSYLESNREHVRGVLRALLAAEAILAARPEEARAVTLAALGPNREAELVEDWSHYHFRLELDPSLILTLEDQARWALSGGWIPEAPIPNYLNLMESRFLGELKPEAVTLRQ
jgi:NitT/TauT family transport system substrate-binding protein